MILTKEVLNQIIQAIKEQSVKDSELPEYNKDELTGKETLAVISDGKSVKIPVNMLEHIRHATGVDYKIVDNVPETETLPNTLYIKCNDSKCDASDEIYMTDKYGKKVKFFAQVLADIKELQLSTFPIEANVSVSPHIVNYNKGKANPTITFKLDYKHKPITPDKISIKHSGVVEDVPKDKLEKGSYVIQHSISDTTEFIVTLERIGSDAITTSVTTTFAHDRYCGVFTDEKPSIEKIKDPENIVTLDRSASYTWKGNLSSEKVFYAYPTYLGQLNDVRDGSNQDLSDTFKIHDKIEIIKINDIDYYLYVMQKETSVNGYEINFKKI